MKLSNEQRKKILESLNSFGVASKCPICKNGNWSISDTIFELREFQGGDLVIGKDQSIYPVLPLTCGQCGNTYFINPIKLGILDPHKKGDKNE